MTIGRKLEIGVGLMLVVVVAIGIAWLVTLGNWDTGVRSAAERTAQRLEIAAEMDSAGSDMLAAMRGIVLYAAAGEPPKAAMCRQEFDAAAGRWQMAIAGMRPLLAEDADKRLVSQMEGRVMAWRAVVVEVERVARRGDSDKALKIASAKGYPLYRANARDTARFRELQEGVQEAKQADTASAVQAGWWTDLGALGLAVVAGLLTLFFVRHTSQIAQTTSDRTASSTEAATVAQGSGSNTETVAPEVPSALVVEVAPPAVEIRGGAAQVEEIAFRTSLLSLNAALAAARPGDAPTGSPAATDQAVILVRQSAPPAKDRGPGTESVG